jgi:inner membrane protein
LDTLTHIVLGACIGEAAAGKKLGKRAMLVGALAQSIPDFDFIAYFWLNKTENLLGHRGFTHSLLFAVFVTAAMAYFFTWYFRRRKVLRNELILLFGLNIFTHLFLDSFNAYGIGLFEPFNHARISFHVLYVADPFFSVWSFLAFIFLLITKMNHQKRKIIWQAGIGMSFVYLMYAFSNKWQVEKDVRSDLKAKHVRYEEFFTTPAPLNSWLWFVVVKDKNGYYTSYRSVLDKGQRDYYYFPRNDSLLALVKDQDEVKDLLRFAQGYYTVERWNDSIAFNVLRFGQVVGWYDPREKFAFHYLLDQPGANHLLVQRGRFEKWNKITFHSFLRRIAGD